MGISSAAVRDEREQMELCREFARMAKVSYTFAVNSDESTSPMRVASIVPTIEDAYDEIRFGRASGMNVVFDWRFGGKSGSGTVRYESQNQGVTCHFVERMVSNLVIQKIADQLHRDWIEESEYDGAISIVKDDVPGL